MRVAGVLVTVPSELLTITSKVAPLSVATVGGVAYTEDVAPTIGVPPLLHWYIGGGFPLALTENVADCPSVTVRFAGCAVIVGGDGVGGLPPASGCG